MAQTKETARVDAARSPPEGDTSAAAIERTVPRRNSWVLIAGLALTALLLAAIGTRHGAAIGPDATVYLSEARNLAAGRGSVDWSLKPVTTFPPGFPVVLSAGEHLGIDAADSARWLNAAAFAALVILTFGLARRHVQRAWLAVAAAAAVAFSVPLLGVTTFAVSEPIFCVLTIGLLLVLESLMAAKGHVVGLIVASALLASSGFALRYAGVTLLALPVLVILVASRRAGLQVLLKHLLLYMAIASVLPALIVARNLSEGSGAMGPRHSSIERVGHLASATFATLRGWALGTAGTAARSLVAALLVAVIVAGLVAAIRRNGWRAQRTESFPLLPLVAFSVGYLAYLWVSELATNLDPIDDRLLSPVFAPLVVLGFFAVDQLLDSGMVRNRNWLTAVITSCVVIWLAASLVTSARRAQSDGARGQGLASFRSTASDFVAAADGIPSSSTVYSNQPGALYHASGRAPIYLSPRDVHYRSTERSDDIVTFRRRLAAGRESYLAWAGSPADGGFLLTPYELESRGIRLEIVMETRHGTIYRVSGAE